MGNESIMIKEMASKLGYKKTELGWTPDDWGIKKVAQVFDFLKTNSLSRSQLSNEPLNEKSIYNIHYGDIHSSFKYELLDVSKEATLPKIIDNQLIKSEPDYLTDGDLVMADASEDYEGICDCVELINVNNIKLVSGLHTFALRDKGNNFINGFKSYLFKNQKVVKSIYRVATGISVLGVSKSNLGKILIPIPTLPEQKKIASILSDWDEAIEKTQTLIEKLQLRKKGLMQQLLTGKTRLNGFSEEWKEEKLGNHLRKHNEITAVSNQYPVLTSSRRGIFYQEDYYTRQVASTDNKGYNVVPRGFFTYRHMSDDLIFKFNINTICDKGIVSTLYPVFKTKNSINDKYLLLALNEGNDFKRFALKQKQGGSRTYMYYGKLEKLKLALPSIDEQIAISSVVELAEKEIKNQEEYLEQLRAQKKGLMQQLLTGKIRVKI